MFVAYWCIKTEHLGATGLKLDEPVDGLEVSLFDLLPKVLCGDVESLQNDLPLTLSHTVRLVAGPLQYSFDVSVYRG